MLVYFGDAGFLPDLTPISEGPVRYGISLNGR